MNKNLTGTPEEQTGTFETGISQNDNILFVHSPMEDICSDSELNGFISRNPMPYFVFCENRENPVRRFDGLPKHWINDPVRHISNLEGLANPGELFVFQLALYSTEKLLEGINLLYENLSNNDSIGNTISKESFSCFSLEARDIYGNSHRKQLSIYPRKLKVLWVGIHIPGEAKGTYSGTLRAVVAGQTETKIFLKIKVDGQVLEDGGESEEDRMARLSWLNSTVGLDDDTVTAPFIPLKRNGKAIEILGRKICLGQFGLPENIFSFFESGNQGIGKNPLPLFASPFRFIVESNGKTHEANQGKLDFTAVHAGKLEWRGNAEVCKEIKITIYGVLEPDGWMSCKIKLKAVSDIDADDIRLEIEHSQEASEYFVGLGHRGGKRPVDFDWRWNE